MGKNSLYKKVIVSVSSVALLSVGLSQMPNNFGSSLLNEVNAAKKSKTIGANSAVYKQQGKKMIKTKQIIKVGKKVSVFGQKMVNGKRYYKIAKNQFIKAVNVDGRTREAAKRTSLYTRKGKIVRNRSIVKGQEVKIFGGAVKIKGQKYYSTKFGYIKANALVKKHQVEPSKDNSENNQPVANDNNVVINTPSIPNNSGSASTVDSLKNAKDDAIIAIKEAIKDATNLIKISPLTDAEKQAAIAKIDVIAKAALGEQKDGKSGSINDAKTVDEVKTTQANVEAECKLVGDKAVANDLVKQAAEFVNKVVVKMEDDEAMTTASDKITAAVDAATAAITNAKAPAEIDQAEKSFQTALNEAVPLAKQQEFAVDAIKAAVTSAKAEIAADTSLTAEEKENVFVGIEAVAKIALGEHEDGTAGQIHDAETTNDILLAQNMVLAKCKAELANSALKDKKSSAITAVKQAVEDASQMINDTPASAKEKQAAIERIDAIAKAALGEQKDGTTGDIYDAISEEEIKSIQDKAVSACELESNKLVSSELVKQAAEFANKAVVKIENSEARITAPDKIVAAVKAAKTAIANAKTSAEIDQAEKSFQTALNEAVPFAKQQEFAVDTIKAAVASTKEKINASASLTAEAKEDALAEIEAVAKIALGEYEDATTGEIHDAKTTNEILLAQNTVISVCQSK